jgi:RNA polymerase sigma-70 factor (ECF subfamily)
MTRNLFIDQDRSKKRKPEVAYDEMHDPRHNPGSVGRQDDINDLNNALNRMTQSCQEVLSLIGIGYRYSEIADMVGIEIGTVMSRLSRCRRKLAEIIR